jgi:1-acyl-sn-glycerol-3-phosphate acyltransferase
MSERIDPGAGEPPEVAGHGGWKEVSAAELRLLTSPPPEALLPEPAPGSGGLPMIGGHARKRGTRDAESRRENWPGEGDRRGATLDYGPRIDLPAPAGTGKLARELADLERHVRRRFALEGEDRGLLDRLQAVLSGAGLTAELRRLQLRHRSEVVDEFGRDARYADQVRPLLRFLFRSYFQVHLEGLEHLPAHGSALLVANHSGTLPLDAAMIMTAVAEGLGREVRPLVEDFVYYMPFVGTAVRRLGGVRASFANAERVLRRGHLAAVFPEGLQGVAKPFTERYQLQRFGRGGFVKLARLTRSPLVPVAVVGAEETYPLLARVSWLARIAGLPFLPVTPTFPWLGPLGLLPLPSRWRITFGPAIELPEELDAGDAASARIGLGRVAEQVRHTLQEMVDTSLRARGGAFG